jgi:hypothetical protein
MQEKRMNEPKKEDVVFIAENSATPFQTNKPYNVDKDKIALSLEILSGAINHWLKELDSSKEPKWYELKKKVEKFALKLFLTNKLKSINEKLEKIVPKYTPYFPSTNMDFHIMDEVKSSLANRR